MLTSAGTRAHVLGFSIKIEKNEEKGETEEEVAKTSRKTEKGNSSKLSTGGENSVSQMKLAPVKL